MSKSEIQQRISVTEKVDITKLNFENVRKFTDEAKKLSDHMKGYSVSIFNCIEIICNYGEVYIEKRPAYCDRGKFIVKIESRDPVNWYIDHQDAFPRYYFDFDCCITETLLWLCERKVKVISINCKGEQDYAK